MLQQLVNCSLSLSFRLQVIKPKQTAAYRESANPRPFKDFPVSENVTLLPYLGLFRGSDTGDSFQKLLIENLIAETHNHTFLIRLCVNLWHWTIFIAAVKANESSRSDQSERRIQHGCGLIQCYKVLNSKIFVLHRLFPIPEKCSYFSR